MGDLFNREKLAKNLPDAYLKTKDSNNFKILEINRISTNKIRDRIHDIDDILDLDNARGITLDLYGTRVGQDRGNATDEKYLILIKARILRNLANGSYNGIVRALSATFGCEPSLFDIQDAEEPATVVLSSLPLSIINKSGLSASQTVAIIKSMIPAGVGLENIILDGTFEFSAMDNEYEEIKGFGDIDQTIGGYFGYLTADDTELPI